MDRSQMHKLSNGESHRFTDTAFVEVMSGTGNKRAIFDLGVASKQLRDVRDGTPCYTLDKNSKDFINEYDVIFKLHSITDRIKLVNIRI